MGRIMGCIRDGIMNLFSRSRKEEASNQPKPAVQAPDKPTTKDPSQLLVSTRHSRNGKPKTRGWSWFPANVVNSLASAFKSVRLSNPVKMRTRLPLVSGSRGKSLPTGKRPRKSRGLPLLTRKGMFLTLRVKRFRDRRPLQPMPWERPTKAERKALQQG